MGAMDVVISVKERSIFKYWIFRRESIPEGGELLEMYLKKMGGIVEVERKSGEEGSWEGLLRAAIGCLG